MHLRGRGATDEIEDTPLKEGTRSRGSGDLIMSELSTDSAETSPPVVEFAPPDIARRHIATWNGLQTDAVEVIRREPFAFEYMAARHLLIMCERAERDDGETVVEGLPRSTLHEYSHKLSFVPAGRRFSGWQKPRALTRVTYFYIDPQGSLIDPALHFAETEFKPRLLFFDKDLWETVQKLKEQAKNPDGQRQYAEALSVVMVHELLRLNSIAGPVKRSFRGGLARWQEKKVAQYIEEHLLEDVPLAILADVAKLSPYHFVRAFKQSFGLPPHRYLSSLRMQRAKSLLANPAMSVTQVGFNLGFSDTSSFTTTFRKHTGLTPTAYRRNLE
jgi:AraC family transcriptional regulator